MVVWWHHDHHILHNFENYANKRLIWRKKKHTIFVCPIHIQYTDLMQDYPFFPYPVNVLMVYITGRDFISANPLPSRDMDYIYD